MLWTRRAHHYRVPLSHISNSKQGFYRTENLHLGPWHMSCCLLLFGELQPFRSTEERELRYFMQLLPTDSCGERKVNHRRDTKPASYEISLKQPCTPGRLEQDCILPQYETLMQLDFFPCFRVSFYAKLKTNITYILWTISVLLFSGISIHKT